MRSEDPHCFECRISQGDVTVLSDLRELLADAGKAVLVPLRALLGRPLLERALEELVQPVICRSEGFQRREHGRILAFLIVPFFCVLGAIFFASRGSTV